MKPLGRILIFSLIETVGVILWAVLAGFKSEASLNTQVIAGVVFFVFFTVEHIAAWNSAKNRPLLSFPPKD